MSSKSSRARRERRVMADMTRGSALEVARKRLKSIDGATPAMAAVGDLLRPARDVEIQARLRTDALLILARASGASWAVLGGMLGTTRQAALSRHARAIRRAEGVGA